MKLHYLRDDALADLKANLGTLYVNYKKPDNAWIFEHFGRENPFGEIKTEFRLNCNYTPENLYKVEMENVRTLYSALRGLTDSQAVDERVWAGLCNCDFYDYVRARWGYSEASEIKAQEIGNRFYMILNKKRAIAVNTLSRLWWTGRFVYDDKRKDPFELLRYFENHYTPKFMFITSNNYLANPTIARGLIAALLELEDEGCCNCRQLFC